ncbi:MAG: hypothetical protein K0B07_02125 [DPANN group archaeon]|nr:hypothetical protein [DPANN group archaeon]
MSIILFMGAMAVASSVVMMSFGSLNKKDERLEYKGKTISESMKYGTAKTLYDTLEKDMVENIKKRNVLLIQISKGAYNSGYGNKKNAEMTVKHTLRACEDAYKELKIRKDDLTRIIEIKEKEMYTTTYTTKKYTNSTVGF